VINHARTLLLNETAVTPGVTWPAEQYVPTAYRRRAVPPVARPAYDTLFPPGCDRAFKNLRLAQLLPLMHSRATEQLVLGLDSRVTYLPFDSAGFDSLRIGTAVVRLAGTASLAVIRTNAAVDRTRLLSSWRVDLVDATHVRLTGLAGPGVSAGGTVSFSATAGLSDPVTLPGTACAVRLPTADAGASWQVTVLADPPGLTELFDAVDSQDYTRLFAGDATGLSRCAEVWTTSPHVTDRLAAVATAVALQLDAAVPGGGT